MLQAARKPVGGCPRPWRRRPGGGAGQPGPPRSAGRRPRPASASRGSSRRSRRACRAGPGRRSGSPGRATCRFEAHPVGEADQKAGEVPGHDCGSESAPGSRGPRRREPCTKSASPRRSGPRRSGTRSSRSLPSPSTNRMRSASRTGRGDAGPEGAAVAVARFDHNPGPGSRRADDGSRRASRRRPPRPRRSPAPADQPPRCRSPPPRRGRARRPIRPLHDAPRRYRLQRRPQLAQASGGRSESSAARKSV